MVSSLVYEELDMRKLILGITLSVALGGSFSAFGQETAAVDPTVPVPPLQPTIAACDEVAKNPEIADPVNGRCVTSTGAYIASLSSLPPETSQQALADLVVALGELVQQGSDVCDKFDDEIAAAVRMAATASTDPDQVASLTEIAQTIDDCAVGQTAALVPPAASSP